MIRHEPLVETVGGTARLDRSDEAAHVARTVLADLTLRLDPPRRRRLRQALPAADRDAAYATVPARGGDLPEFLRDVGGHLQVAPERARHLAGSVLSALRAEDPALARELRGHLPPGIGELFGTAGTDPARRHPDTEAPAPLTDAEVRQALHRRPAWTGGTRRLERTVRLPPDRIRPLLHRVELATGDLGHRFGHHIGAGEITFILRTRSVDAVTDADLPLADAIDAAVDAFGSGG